VMMGRAAQSPLPSALKVSLQPPLASVADAAKVHLAGCAAALMSKQAPPLREPWDLALARYTAQLEATRRADAFRALSEESLERLLAVSFTLEQMHRNLQDLDRSVAGWAAGRG
jgi:hypothetical protein